MQIGDIYFYDLQAEIKGISKRIRPLMLLEVGTQTSMAVLMTYKFNESVRDSHCSYGRIEYEDSYSYECFFSDRPVKISNDDLLDYKGRFADDSSVFNDILSKATSVKSLDLSSITAIENDEELDLDSAYSGIYPLGNIKVDKGFFTTFELKRKYDSPEKKIVLDSDFQRENVWSIKQNSELIESVLMGLPLPIFYFNQDKYGRIIVVDGRQRLTALFKYMNGDYALRGLRVLDLNGRRFDDLSPLYQTKIEDYQISAHVIMPPTPERIKYDIFDRVNRGGTMLNKQEIRNALYQGKSTRLLNEIVSTDEFAHATGGAFNRDKRMKNKYLVSRFFAGYLYLNNIIKDSNGNSYVYGGDIDDLLGRTLDTINTMQDEDVEKIKNLTTTLLSRVYAAFGENAFRMPSENGKKNPINMNLFEFIMIAMLNVKLEKNSGQLYQNVIEEINKEEFLDNIGNHRDGAIKYEWRLQLATQIGKEIS